MKWAKKVFTSEQLEAIEKRIKSVEKGTSAEIIPMVVRQSSTVGHVPLLALTMGLLISFAIGLPEIQEFYVDSIWIFIPLHLLFLLFMVRIVGSLPAVCRWLTPKEDQKTQVEMRAQLEFYQADTHITRHNTGILIFVSLLERQVVVLADKAIADKNPPDTWEKVVKVITKSIHNKDLAEGLQKGIEMCGEILKKDFPIAPDDTNELPNHLVIKE